MPRQEKTCRIAQTATISVSVFSSIDFDDHDRVTERARLVTIKLKSVKGDLIRWCFFRLANPVSAEPSNCKNIYQF